MFNIDNCNVKITRGDTGVIAISLQNKDGSSYEMQPDDVLVMTVKTNTFSKDVLIEKQFADGQIKIDPADTDNLSYGTYYYDVQLTTAAGDVFTVITPHKFEIMPEVTWNE